MWEGSESGSKEVKKVVTEEEERSEGHHKMRSESSWGHGFLWAMVRNVDFIQSKTENH